jgi:acetoin utilization deacetylase AcuC-like enzyme
VTRRALLARAGGALALALAPRAALAAPATLFVAPPASHDPGPGQPDAATRLAAICARLAEPDFAALARADAPLMAREKLLAVHAPAMLERLESAAPRRGHARLSPDLVMSPGTLDSALRSAGGAALAVDAVLRGAAKNAFVATRPPGHHATAAESMGFCFFNNAAIAACHALDARGAERVVIVDFDAHHGNGVQEIFWSEKRVLYCSTHQSPLYPGTGAFSETGAHDNIVNAPLRKGDDGAAFRAALTQRILPRLDAFAPDLILFCAGFDAHLHDPLAQLRFVEEDFRDVTLRVMEIAARRCGGRIVSLLEGGYRTDDLARSVAAHVGALAQA